MSSNYFKTNTIRSTKAMTTSFSQIKKPVLRSMLQACVQYIENKTYSPSVLQTSIQKLEASGLEVDTDNFAATFAGIFLILQHYLHAPKLSIKDDELREVLKEVKFTDESIDDIMKVLLSRRDTLAMSMYESKALRNAPTNIRWRINISLMESGISGRLAQPTIVFQMQLSNGEFKTFEMTMAVFHRFRYNVASLLKEMQLLETRPIMKK